MQKKIIATAIAASTLGGAAAGAAFLTPGLAGAQDGNDANTTEADEAVRPEAGERVREALQPLVADGTLTDAEVEAVVEALAAARPDGFRAGHRAHRGIPGGADIAELLGLEPSEVRDALRDGSSIADLAAEQGVDVDSIVDSIVEAAEERVDAALESGRIDQEKADEILANAEEHAEDFVNGELERPEGRRFGHGFRRGPGFDGSGDGSAEPALDA